MSKVVQSLVAHAGKYIVMPPHKEAEVGWGNLAEPQVQVVGGHTVAEYPVNTKFVDFDRTFIYGYTHSRFTTDVKSNLGLFNLNTAAFVTWGGVAGAAGDTVCPILTSTMDDYTTATVNLFAGGYLLPRQQNPYGCYRIVSSTVFAGGADSALETDMVIEEPGLQAIVTASSAYCQLHPNIYSKMYGWWSQAGGTHMSVVGVTLIDPTAETYQWVQTWGPICMLGDEAAGKTTTMRAGYFNWDGTIITAADNDGNTQYQYAGYFVPYSLVAAAGVYASLIFIQLER